MNHCLTIWDFDEEIKEQDYNFFGSIALHHECILAPFVVFLVHLVERLDPKAVTHDIKLKQVQRRSHDQL